MAGLTRLGKHLRGYADDGEAWKPDHVRVMALHDIADCLSEEVSYGLYLYQRLTSRTTRTFEDAQSLYANYLDWYERSVPVLRYIEASEKKEFPVEGSAEFKAAFKDIHSQVAKIKGRIDALQEIIDGNGITAEEFLGSL